MGGQNTLQAFRKLLSATGDSLRTSATAPTLHLHGRGLVEPAARAKSQEEAFERGLNVRKRGWLTTFQPDFELPHAQIDLHEDVGSCS